MSAALEAPTARGVAERLLHGALVMQASASEPKGCLGVLTSLLCGAEAELIRNDVIARRAVSDAALVERLARARGGDRPDGIDPAALARYLGTVLQGLSVRAETGVDSADLRATVDTVLAMWAGR